MPFFTYVDGKTDTGSVAFRVETDLAQRRVDVICLQGLAQGIVVGGAGLFDGVEQRQCGGIRLGIESARIFAVGLAVLLDGLIIHGVARKVFGTGGIYTLGILAGDFNKGVVLDAVIGNKRGLHLFLAHLGHDLGGFRVIATENDRIGTGLLDLLNNGGVIHRSRRHALEEHHLGARIFFQEALGEFGQPLAVVALVVQHGNLLGLQIVEGEVDFQLGLGVV